MHPTITAGLPPEYPFPEPHPGFPKPESTSPPVPIIFETSVLDSGIDWLDRMIRRSRKMDAGSR